MKINNAIPLVINLLIILLLLSVFIITQTAGYKDTLIQDAFYCEMVSNWKNGAKNAPHLPIQTGWPPFKGTEPCDEANS